MSNSYLPFHEKYVDPQPITSFVVKVASRCNIQCSYCYMYEHADQTWRDQPAKLSKEHTELLATRLREYAIERKLKRLLVIAHGGEPLLLGSEGLNYFFGTISSAFSDLDTQVGFGMQTNALLVADEIVDVLYKFDVRAGVSIDGPKEWNDLARIDKHGNGTFERVMIGVDKLRNNKHGKSVFGGYLTVANPDIAPGKLFDFFENLDAPAVDFLIPDFNYDTYPFDKYPIGTFGKWLTQLFDIWMDSDSNMRIRIFRTIMRLLLGTKRGFDAFGSLSQGVVVIETDGTYHALDVLKTAYHGATFTGKSLQKDSIISLESLALVLALTSKKAVLNQKCLDCHLVDICGGGYLPHRYSSVHGFDKESLYCEDLQILINHISNRLSVELSTVEKLKVMPWPN